MADITQEHLTNADKLCVSTDGKYTVSGDGVFDDIMEAVNLHLDSQFKLNRLTGEKYADVYLGSLQSSLAAAVQFVLGEQRADKEADLLHEQIEHEKLKMLQTKAQTEQIKAQTDLIRKEIEKTAKEIELLQEQIELTSAKKCTELAQACGPPPEDGTVLDAQIKLYEQQKEAFTRKSENDLLKTLLQAQNMNANIVGQGLCEVGIFQADGVDNVTKEVAGRMGLNIPGPDSGECASDEAEAEEAKMRAIKLIDEINLERSNMGLDLIDVTKFF